MIRDQGPKYTLGFGISPSNVPIESNESGILQEGPNPQSGFIAKALSRHPVMRFFAVSAATMAGMHVAGKLVKSGGVKLISELASEEGGMLGKRAWKTSLLNDFQRTQRALNEWQGIAAGEPVERAGFWASQAVKERIYDAARAGEEITESASWTFRDELQQTLVRQARRLPYELPALYATQRLVSDRLLGGQEKTQEHPKWYNPIDVIGDFAEQSVKNIAFTLAPWEAAGAGLKQGFRNLMTYGDFATAQTPFNTRLYGHSQGLREVLRRVGHDSSSLLHSGIQKSLRSTGAFAAAITNFNDATRSTRDQATAAKQMFRRNPIETFDGIFPKLGGFRQGFAKAWDSEGDYFANVEALRAGKSRYTWNGEVRAVRPEDIRGGRSDLEQIAAAVNHLKGVDPDGKDFHNAGFSRMRQMDEYRRLLKKNLMAQGINEDAAHEFAYKTNVLNLPNRFKDIEHSQERVQFGAGKMYAKPGKGFSAWHEQLQQRLDGVVGTHARSIAESIDPAIKDADKEFLKGTRQMRARIRTEWNTAYQDGVIPYAKQHLGEARLSYERFGPGMDPDDREILVRKTAERLGIPTLNDSGHVISQRDILGELGKRGFNTTDPYDLRNFLVSTGDISKPWTEGGFNLLGLKPLDVRSALRRNYFSPDVSGGVRNVLGGIEQTDPYIGSLLRRPVGPGVYETRSGSIVDLSHLRGGFSKFLNMVEEHTQIPLLRFNPLSLFAWKSKRAMAESPILQFMSGEQQFGDIGPSRFNMWTRTRKSKGSLFEFGDDGLTQVPGVYRPTPTDPNSLLGRMNRIALGDKGQRPVADPRGPIRKALDFDVDQPQSLFQFFSRIKNRKGDLRNPAEYSRWLRSGGRPKTLEEIEAFDPFMDKIRGFGITGKVARLFRGTDIDQRIMQDAEGRSFASIRNPSDMLRSAKNTLEKHLEEIKSELDISPDDPQLRDQLLRIQRAQGVIRSRYISNEMQPSFFEGSSAQAMRSTGIHTRLDEFRADMYRYMAAHEAITQGDSEYVMGQMLSHLDDLKRLHKIGGSEYTEARAAVLSMHVNLLSLETYKAGITPADHVKSIVSGLMGSHSANILDDLASYSTDVIHKGGGRKWITQTWLGGRDYSEGFKVGKYDIMPERLRGRAKFRGLGRADYEYPGTEYNPFGTATTQFMPTFGTLASKNMRGAFAGVTGASNDPSAMSGAAYPVNHFFFRLNRYFSTLGMGLDETAYGSPLGYMSKGLIGRRVLPAVALGTVGMAADRTLGAHIYGKDPYGNRVYRPAVTGVIARGIAGAQVGMAGLIPGGQTAQEKRDELYGDKEVAIRKGRWWPLGNQPFRGGRISYFRPSWYKRFTSGYQYGDQNWSSPTEKLAFGHDFSPLRPFDPYRWERKHMHDRPYPVTGEYFTGPWGPVTGAANLAVGRFLKPSVRMHQREMEQAMSQYQLVGTHGMVPPQPSGSDLPPVATRNPTGSMGVFSTRTARDILRLGGGASTPPPAQGEDWTSAYQQPWGFMSLPYGTSPNEAIAHYDRRRIRGLRRARPAAGAVGEAGDYPYANAVGGVGRPGRGRSIAVAGPAGGRAPSGDSSRLALSKTNAYYEGRAKGGKVQRGQYDPYNRVVLTKTRGFDPRVVPAADPIDPGSLKYQAGQLGYETQELFGIYGFMFGSLRESLGFGTQDFSPRKPVLQAASRGYGSERSFWDLNLGGLGDLPNASEGEYGNLEFSEISRRFIPHRRRDITELNPLPNDIGKMYPWLPGPEYFINFHQGDPYAAIPEGEMRLPGEGYERTHKLHPDATGKYGLIDQHAILGDIAPWSQQYRAVDRVIDKMKMHLSEEDYAKIKETRKQVSAQNKRIEFSPYKYGNADFQEKEVKVFGFKPGDTDTLLTSDGPIRFAGTRIRGTREARLFAEGLIEPGSIAKITYDANRPPSRGAPTDAIVEVNGENINRTILHNEEFGLQARTSAPIDSRVRQSRFEYGLRHLGEQLSHRNTILNTKFLPRRTAVEDWERNNVYGTTFPQWQHPIRDFVKPIGYKAMNRNPFVSMAILGAAGSMFGSSPAGHAVGGLIGGAVGLGLGVFSGAKTLETGHRFLPMTRRKELAVEEYTDILNYVKYSSLYAAARQDAIKNEKNDPERIARRIEEGGYKKFQIANLGQATSHALAFRQKAMQTEYGADVYGDVLNLSAAIPKRKRDHFLAFLNAPVNERPRILSTAPRLERRIYEARWGMKVERRPDLREYFAEHELPDQSWEGWNPNVDIEDVKLKIASHQGLDVSQMGYYPQQIKEAQLQNAAYPDYGRRSSQRDAANRLSGIMSNRNRIQSYLSSQGINGNVIAVPNGRGDRIQLNAGVR